ncbi:MAG: hypothetical protein OHK0011_24990 [Turneriella sp.]
MQPVKVIHLIKRVEQIDKEIAELHGLVDGIDSTRSYRNALKIAAEQQINNLIGEKVKLMELKIENPPEFLTKHVYPEEQAVNKQPRISLEALQGGVSTTYNGPAAEVDEMPTGAKNPLRSYTRMMSVEEILPKAGNEPATRSRRAEKPPVKTRADILRDLPPLQY